MEAVEDLLRVLDLDDLGDGRFRGITLDRDRTRIFGGQVVAQALVAAQRTVPNDRFCHSLHAYFLRGGDPATPIVLEVDPIRNGGSFTTRRVVALQDERAIFSLSASFQTDQDGFEHGTDMPDVPGPDEVPHGEALAERIARDAPLAIRRYWHRPRPIEFRPILLDHYLTEDKLEPLQRIWVRCTGEIGDDRHLNAAVLAYLSDMTLLDTSLFAHGLSVFDRRVQAASLDHAMWFHRPARVSDWLLYAQDSPSSSGGRGLSRGSLFSRDGSLVASVAQEGLIRPRRRTEPV